MTSTLDLLGHKPREDSLSGDQIAAPQEAHGSQGPSQAVSRGTASLETHLRPVPILTAFYSPPTL